jgi:hypothetical protein
MLQRWGRFWDGACDLLLGQRTYVDLSQAFGPPGRRMLRPAASLAARANRRRVRRLVEG